MNERETKQYKYDAFISYRHADLDIYAAEQLHKLLENFKVPRLAGQSLKMHKKKPISRVFRDKDELPASDNLAEPIEEALRTSQFLIVVCSPRTPESKWVSREIELFIQYHGRENVLALLIEGEPEDAFPKAMCLAERQVPQDDGTIITEQYEIEPLASDVRAASKTQIHRKLKKEILRLAAPILHCSYDDLKQRHKEQKLKNMLSLSAVIAAVLLIFGTYATIQNVQIRKLQSKSLAVQAAEAYRKGDRKEGLSLIQTALRTRYTPQAQAELTDLMQVYENGETFKPVAVAKHDAKVMYMAVNEDCSLVITIDELHQVYLWDAVTGDFISKEDSIVGNVVPNTLCFLDRQTAIYCGGNGVALFDTTNRETKLVIDSPLVTWIALSHNHQYLLISDGFNLNLYHTKTWDLCYSSNINLLDECNITGALNVTDDGSYISYGMSDMQTKSYFVVVDTKKDQVLYQKELPYDWVEFSRLEENAESYVLSKDFLSIGSTLLTGNEELLHFDAQGNEKWNYTSVMLMRNPIEKKGEDIIIASNSDLIFIDIASGKERTRVGFSSTIQNFIVRETSIDCYLHNGTAFSVQMQDNHYEAKSILNSAVDVAKNYVHIDNRIIIMPESDIQLFIYENKVSPDMQWYEPLPSLVSSVVMNEKGTRFAAYNFGIPTLSIFDALTGQLVGSPITGKESELINAIISTSDGTNFVMITNQCLRICSWDDGSIIREIPLDKFIGLYAVSGDGKVLCIYDYDALYTISLTPDSTWEPEKSNLSEQLFYQFFLNYDGTKLLSQDALMTGKVYDFKSKELENLSWTSSLIAYNEMNSDYVIVNQNTNCIELYNAQNQLVDSMEKASSVIQGLGFSKDGKYLWIQNLDATVEIYKTSGFNFVNKLEDIPSPIRKMDTVDQKTYVLYGYDDFGGPGYLCNQDIEIIGRIPKLFCISPDGKTIYSANKECVLSTKLYSLKDLTSH